uniref:Uncharacterized protein n=1 Tax=Trypanosoma vivax (strain Y486) TaxID=1055687 RepID=G0U9Z3_TRYVY|nr:hypothetical protein TVY486_1101090 [Trypanosoma vivax Y486]
MSLCTWELMASGFAHKLVRGLFPFPPFFFFFCVYGCESASHNCLYIRQHSPIKIAKNNASDSKGGVSRGPYYTFQPFRSPNEGVRYRCCWFWDTFFELSFLLCFQL